MQPTNHIRRCLGLGSGQKVTKPQRTMSSVCERSVNRLHLSQEIEQVRLFGEPRCLRQPSTKFPRFSMTSADSERATFCSSARRIVPCLHALQFNGIATKSVLKTTVVDVLGILSSRRASLQMSHTPLYQECIVQPRQQLRYRARVGGEKTARQ